MIVIIYMCIYFFLHFYLFNNIHFHFILIFTFIFTFIFIFIFTSSLIILCSHLFKHIILTNISSYPLHFTHIQHPTIFFFTIPLHNIPIYLYIFSYIILHHLLTPFFSYIIPHLFFTLPLHLLFSITYSSSLTITSFYHLHTHLPHHTLHIIIPKRTVGSPGGS